RYGKLANQKLSSNYWMLAQQVNQLQDAFDHTLAHIDSLCVTHPDEDYLRDSRGFWATQCVPFPVTTFPRLCPKPSPFQLVCLLAILWAMRLARRLFVRIQKAKVRLSGLRQRTTF